MGKPLLQLLSHSESLRPETHAQMHMGPSQIPQTRSLDFLSREPVTPVMKNILGPMSETKENTALFYHKF